HDCPRRHRRLASDRDGPADAEHFCRRAQHPLAAGVDVPGGDAGVGSSARRAGQGLGQSDRVVEVVSMDLQAEVDKEQDVLQRIPAVARRWPCGPFADLLWDELDFDVALSNNPGVIFESPIRAVVFQYVRGELRYYAGGWSPDPRHDPKG